MYTSNILYRYSGIDLLCVCQYSKAPVFLILKRFTLFDGIKYLNFSSRHRL